MFSRQTLAIGVLLALIQNSSFAELSASGRILLEQGQYWQARNDKNRASEAWRKLLAIDPQQADALYGMGMLDLKAGNSNGAKRYLDQLQQFHPAARQTLLLEQEIAVRNASSTKNLEEARQLAQSGELDQAVAAYRKLFGDKLPQGDLGLEFYSYLGYTKGGSQEARRGLERLLALSPENAKIKLNLAKLLLRNEGTRIEGVRRLASYSKDSDIGSEAIEAWREGLTWLGVPRSTELPLFEEFLRAYPQDQEIRELLNKGRQRGAGLQQDPLITSGLRALEQGDSAAAEKAFQSRLATHPDDPDALGGLGVVRQQQNRYAEAEQLLARAISKGGSSWRTSLDSVRYWSLLAQAREQQTAGQFSQAQELVNRAMRLNSRPIDGQLAMGDIQVDAGEFENAARSYRNVLAVQPGEPRAIRGLVNATTGMGQPEDALRLLDSLSAAEQAKFGDVNRLYSLRAVQLAKLAEQRGDIVGAQSALRDAVSYEPENIWTRFSLARLYVSSGEPAKGRQLIDTFINKYPDNMDGLYTSALLSVETGDWKEAQAILDRIPPDRRTASMHELADQATLTVQVNEAVGFAKRGQRQQALGMLEQLEPMASGNPERMATLASAYADVDDPQRAESMMSALVSQSKTPSSELMLQYAAVLLKTGDDTQVHSILRKLQNQSMNTATRKRYDDVLYAYRIRQADQLREGGDLEAAYDTLAPALVQRPGDVAATSALARMYSTNADHAKALDLYKSLLKTNAKDPAVLLGAANSAVLAQDRAYANDALERFVGLQSGDPASLTEAARIYQSMGKTNEATALLRKAVLIEQTENQRSLAMRSGTVNVAQNPFRGQRSQTSATSVSAVPLPAQTVLNRNIAAPTGNPFLADDGRQDGKILAAPAMKSRTFSPAIAMNNEVIASEPDVLKTRSRSVKVESVNSSPAQNALNEILQARSAYVVQGVNIRSNDSEAGLSRLTDIQTPLEVSIPAGESRFALRITPVMLSAGTMNEQGATRFGTASLPASAIGSQRDEGVGISLAYELKSRGLKADIGTTPLGFERTNMVGGVSLERPLENNPDVRYSAALSRRAVTDSVTSFAGTTIARDLSPYTSAGIPESALSWGAVTANGGRVQLSYDDSDVGVYGYGSLHGLIGHNVKSNTRVELGAGAYRYIQNDPDRKVTAGLSGMLMGYANNQNFFTYGHGGYFSPQAYFSLGVPVTWSQRNDRFTFQLRGSVGLQYFQQDGVDYFPNDANAQALIDKRFPEQSSSGLGYGVEASGEYRFGPKLFVGGRFAMDNARDYRQLNAGMYVRYMFESMLGSPMALPVSPYRSPYSN